MLALSFSFSDFMSPLGRAGLTDSFYLPVVLVGVCF